MEKQGRVSKRVAFFGGSFDPPHEGHLAVARAAREALALDTVLFAPVGAQPLKPSGSTASFEDRLAMTSLAIAGDPGFALSRIDEPNPDGTPNYTVDALRALRAQLTFDTPPFCLMGTDSFLGLKNWHRSREIPFLAPLIVASRPGQPMDYLESALPAGLILEPQSTATAASRIAPDSEIVVWELCIRNPDGRTTPFYLLPGLQIDISASQIREEVRKVEGGDHPAGRSSQAGKRLLPNAVFQYIREHGLYR